MKAIDEYLNSIYKNNKSDEILELKEEMKEHLIESVNDIVSEGHNKDEAVKIAISRFDGGIEMSDEINTEFIEKNHIKKLRNLFFIFLTLTLVSIFIEYNNTTMSIESNEASKVEEKLKYRLNKIIDSKDINDISSYGRQLDKLLDENEFSKIASIDIYNKINYIPIPENISKLNEYEITNLPGPEEKYKGREENLIFRHVSKEIEEYIGFDGETQKNELGQRLYYSIKFKHLWYYGLETKISIVLGVISLVIFANFYKIESEHLRKKDKKQNDCKKIKNRIN